MVPRENKNNAYAKFWGGGGANKEHYGIFQSGLLAEIDLLPARTRGLGPVVWWRVMGYLLYK